MRIRNETNVRVLAIDPTTKGFGYVIFEGPDRLVDWGTPSMGGDKNLGTRRRIAELLAWYRPDFVVLEDVGATGCRRRQRVRHLLRTIGAQARGKGIRVVCVDRRALCTAFAEVGCRNKDDIAAYVAAKYPELKPYLPPRRRIWMSEDWRIGLFDAAALALTYFGRRKERAAAAAIGWAA